MSHPKDDPEVTVDSVMSVLDRAHSGNYTSSRSDAERASIIRRGTAQGRLPSYVLSRLNPDGSGDLFSHAFLDFLGDQIEGSAATLEAGLEKGETWALERAARQEEVATKRKADMEAIPRMLGIDMQEGTVSREVATKDMKQDDPHLTTRPLMTRMLEIHLEAIDEIFQRTKLTSWQNTFVDRLLPAIIRHLQDRELEDIGDKLVPSEEEGEHK